MHGNNHLELYLVVPPQLIILVHVNTVQSHESYIAQQVVLVLE